MEWIVGSYIPPIEGATYEVQTLGDHVRTAEYRPDWGSCLYLTDCTHPCQNTVLDRDRIKAWRLVAVKEPEPKPQHCVPGYQPWMSW